MKQMILKLNNTVNEKENRIVQLERVYLKRPKRFQVLMRLTIGNSLLNLLDSTTKSRITNDVYNDWCLIFIDSPPLSASSSSSSSTSDLSSSPAPSSKVNGEEGSEMNGGKEEGNHNEGNNNSSSASSSSLEIPRYRWIEYTILQEWIQSGSSLIGNIPSSLDHLFSSSYHEMKDSLTNDKNEISYKYEELQKQFSTYQIRAQTALKRLNQEEKEKIEFKEKENYEISRLHHTIEELLNEKETLFLEKNEFQEKIQLLSIESKQFKIQLQKEEEGKQLLNEQIKELESKVSKQTNDLLQLQQEIDKINSEKSNLQSSFQQKKKEYEDLSLLVNSSTSSSSSSSQQQHQQYHHQPLPLAIPVLEKDGFSSSSSLVPNSSFKSNESGVSSDSLGMVDDSLANSEKHHHHHHHFVNIPLSPSPHQQQQQNQYSPNNNNQRGLLAFQQVSHCVILIFAYSCYSWVFLAVLFSFFFLLLLSIGGSFIKRKYFYFT
jgi:FtsZ-binding cell division protein ZapB